VAPDGSRGVAVLHCSRWDGGWDKLADQYRGSNTLVLAVVDKPKYPELRWDLTLLQYPRPELTQAVAGIISNLAKEHLRLEKESGVTVNASLMRSFISEHEGHFQVQLREFRLAVGAEVFVAEAGGDLVVAIEP